MVMDIRIDHVEQVICQRVFIQEKGERFVSFFLSLLLVETPYSKATGTDNENSQSDSQLLVFLSWVNRLGLFLFKVNTGELRRKAADLAGDEGFVLEDINKRKEMVK
jgi:hypothetical protein